MPEGANGVLKPGYKTTEFWLSLAAVLVGGVMSSGVLAPLGAEHWLVKVIGLVATILGALGYTAVRGFTKSSTARAAAVVETAKLNPPLPKPPEG